MRHAFSFFILVAAALLSGCGPAAEPREESPQTTAEQRAIERLRYLLAPAQAHAQLFPSNPTETMELGKGRYDTVAVRPPQELLVRDFILGPLSSRPACTAQLVGRFHINQARQISYCNATAWVPIGGVLRQSTPPTCNNNQPVRLYEDSDDNRLYRCIGTTWTRIADDGDRDGFGRDLATEDDNNANDRGDPDLVANNLRDLGSGNLYYGLVRGGLISRGNIALGTLALPGTANNAQTFDMADGIYEGTDRVTYTIPGDADLVVGNIKKGTEIFGVTGTLRYETLTTYTAPRMHNTGSAWQTEDDLPGAIFLQRLWATTSTNSASLQEELGTAIAYCIQVRNHDFLSSYTEETVSSQVTRKISSGLVDKRFAMKGETFPANSDIIGQAGGATRAMATVVCGAIAGS